MTFEESLEHLRAICRSFPETSERLSHGAPTFFARQKKAFVMLMNDHHGDGRLALWCAAVPGQQDALRTEPPAWFFVPPYVGHRGWIGIRLDRDLDVTSITEFITDAYCATAPPRLTSPLETPPSAS